MVLYVHLEKENVSYFFVFHMEMIMYFDYCVLSLHVLWRLFSVSPAAMMIVIVQQVVASHR